ncbi:MAG TPA: ABC-ATPase domain-containing protein [Myxococcota bacterium]|nr:ABC-ATPase domain-containing protein [Myxococcota bacterium]
MRGESELRSLLARIDGRGFRAYEELRGSFRLGAVELHVDHVQPDPFAPPSRVRLRLAADEAGFPSPLFEGRTRRIALEDYLARAVRRELSAHPRGHGEGRSGVVRVDAGGQAVLERTAVAVRPDFVEARLAVSLPAAERRVLGREAALLLAGGLRQLARAALRYSALPAAEVAAFVGCVEDQEHLRAQLAARGLVGFLADGSILPRASGASDLPLGEGAVPLRAPDSLRVELDLPARGGAPRSLAGLGIPEGVTLVVGGGYHGKSTLLRALERGVHPHVPGDGREAVVTRADAVKLRAEDGRRVEQVDVSAFLGPLPGGGRPEAFCSENASGSTSQAANLIEALEAGSRLLLVDEDSAATNFMLRDARMQALVPKEHEPLTPFVDRVRELYERCGVSSVLVTGGCGDYLDVADTVIELRAFEPFDATARAREVAHAHPSARVPERAAPFALPAPRVPLPGSLDATRGRREVKIAARGRELLEFGVERIELGALDQLLETSQTRAIGFALELVRRRFVDGTRTLPQILDALDALLDERGLDVLDPLSERAPRHPGDFARPRRYEIAAALSRLRSLAVATPGARARRAAHS